MSNTAIRLPKRYEVVGYSRETAPTNSTGSLPTCDSRDNYHDDIASQPQAAVNLNVSPCDVLANSNVYL